MIKIVHIADTHIRNYRYHKEYVQVFTKMEELLKKFEPDLIIHCGDIAHTKLDLSPEYFQLAADFLSMLSSISPTYILLGNHDGNLKVKHRQDAVTPVVEMLQGEHPNLHLLKKTKPVFIKEHNVELYPFSLFDDQEWPLYPVNDERINIALFHAPLRGCMVDSGHKLEHGSYSAGMFKHFDYTFLGDIHKSNQAMDKEGRIRYCGSTIQQDFGETDDKGFLAWVIKDKDTFKCKHIQIPNPKPFTTVELHDEEDLKKYDIKKNCRLRIENYGLLPDQLSKAISFAKVRYTPDSISFIDKTIYEGNEEYIEISKNILDDNVQNKMILDYLKSYDLPDDILNEITSINSSIQIEKPLSNNNWSIRKMEWSNYFKFNEKNSIDFTQLNGVVGILGKNKTGKSSVIDTITYTLFNKTTKPADKSAYAINKYENKAISTLYVESENKSFKIVRELERKKRKSKKKKAPDANTTLNFYVNDIPENGDTRANTDQIIRSYFGSVDDFLLTSLSSYEESMKFVNEGGTKRKQILARFLGLELFAKKHAIAKEDSKYYKKHFTTLSSKIENLDKEAKIEEVVGVRKEIQEYEDKRSSLDIEINKLSEKINLEKQELARFEEVPDGSTGETILEINSQYDDLVKIISGEVEETLRYNQLQTEIGELVSLKSQYDEASLLKDVERLNKLSRRIRNKVQEMSERDQIIRINKVKIDMFRSVPCGDKFPNCVFIRDAKSKIDKFQELLEEYKQLKEEREELESERDNLSKSQEDYGAYKNLTSAISRKELEVERVSLKLQRITALKSKKYNGLDDLHDKYKETELFESEFEQREEIVNRILEYRSEISELNRESTNYAKALKVLYKQEGFINREIANYDDLEEELNSIKTKHIAYEYYLKCMHPNGIPFDIIKSNLGVINKEVYRLLANICDFSITFEAEEKKLGIYIKDNDSDKRLPLQSTGSGMEKTIAAMAIRLALLKITNLPKSDIFVLDEPGTALDSDSMQGFVNLLQMMKQNFKTVFLISHLETLKDCCDSIITIEKQGKYSHVEH